VQWTWPATYDGDSPADNWICGSFYSIGDVCEESAQFQQYKDDPTTWEIDIESIAYCLSEKRPQKCQVQSNLVLAIVVIATNLGKAAVMLVVAFGIKGRPLMSIGDAVAEYLRRPDLYTEGMCLVSREDIERSNRSFPKGPKTFVKRYRRLFAAASKRRWTLCVAM
jgi:hypothetical protein